MGNNCEALANKRSKKAPKPKGINNEDLNKFFMKNIDEYSLNQEVFNIKINFNQIKFFGLKSLTYILNYSQKKKIYSNPYYVLKIKLSNKEYPLLYSNTNNPIFSFVKEEILLNKTIQQLKLEELSIKIYELNNTDDVTKMIKNNNRNKESNNPNELPQKAADILLRRCIFYSEIVINLFSLLIGPEDYKIELLVYNDDEVRIPNSGFMEFKVKCECIQEFEFTIQNVSLSKRNDPLDYKLSNGREIGDDVEETINPSIIYNEQIYMSLNLELLNYRVSSKAINIYDTNQLNESSSSIMPQIGLNENYNYNTLTNCNDISIASGGNRTIFIQTKMMSILELYQSILNLSFLFISQGHIVKKVDGYYSLNNIKDKILLDMANIYNNEVEKFIKTEDKKYLGKHFFTSKFIPINEVSIVIDSNSYSLSFEFKIENLPKFLQIKKFIQADNGLIQTKFTVKNLLESISSDFSKRQIPFEQIFPKLENIYLTLQHINPDDSNNKNIQIITNSIETFRGYLLQSIANDYFFYDYTNIKQIACIVYCFLHNVNVIVPLISMCEFNALGTFLEVLRILVQRRELDNKILFDILKDSNIKKKKKNNIPTGNTSHSGSHSGSTGKEGKESKENQKDKKESKDKKDQTTPNEEPLEEKYMENVNLINEFNIFICNLIEINKIIVKKKLPPTMCFNLSEFYGIIFFKYKIIRIILSKALAGGSQCPPDLLQTLPDYIDETKKEESPYFKRSNSLRRRNSTNKRINKKMTMDKQNGGIKNITNRNEEISINDSNDQSLLRKSLVPINQYEIIDEPNLTESTKPKDINVYVSQTTKDKLMEINIDETFPNLVKQESVYLNIIKYILKQYNSYEYPFIIPTIPIFQPLIKIFLNTIQTKGINLKYSFYYWEVVRSYVYDTDLLNKTILYIFQKTNAYDSSAVYGSLDFIHSILSYCLANLKIKPKINYEQLQTILLILLGMENALVITKIFWLYYTDALMMDEEHLKWFICNVVNTKMMIYLFHWSWKVRMMFIKFLLFCLKYQLGESKHNEGIDLYNNYVDVKVIELVKAKEEKKIGELMKIYKGFNFCDISIGIKDFHDYSEEYETWRKSTENLPEADPPYISLIFPKDEDIS